MGTSSRFEASVESADDVGFDAVYPEAMRFVSRRFWTPVAVAKRAAELFTTHAARRVLDVGDFTERGFSRCG